MIKNWDEVLSYGNREARAALLDIIEAGLAAVGTYTNTRKLVRVDHGQLHVGGQPDMVVSGYGDETIDLNGVGRIFVVGAGKAVQHMARALEDILGDRLAGGAITAKRGEGCHLSRIAVTEGGHPVPDEGSIAGTQRIVEVARTAKQGDLVFTLFSSGSSSLFTLPADGYTLDEIRSVYRLAIKYGSQSIIWRVMNYFSAVGSGRITALIHPARTINLVQSIRRYEPWNGALYMGGNWIPSWPPGPQRMAESVEEMCREVWWGELPERMRAALERRDERLEVPGIEGFRQMALSYWQPMHHRQMLEAAGRKADELGLRGVILGSFWGVTSLALASVLAEMAKDCACHGSPFAPPVALITGGEAANPIGNATGVGGRNQEFALVLANKLGERDAMPLAAAAVDSDGTDGPGWWEVAESGATRPRCLAGGIVDETTLPAAHERGIDLVAELANHNATRPLLELGSGIETGNTGTCAGDLRVILVPARMGTRGRRETPPHHPNAGG